jgi:hypothetical protein
MLKLIRVILSAEMGGFVSGMGRASSILGGFLGAARSAFTGAVSLANNLINALAHLPDAVNNITGAIEGLFGPALQRERQLAIFTSLTGSAEQAADMMGFLREETNKFGADFEGLSQSAQQVAVALKSTFGEIDPTKSRITAPVTMANESLEAFSIAFDDGGNMHLGWDKVRVAVPVK